MPIVLAAVLIDTIGFGIVMPVFPALITRLGHVGIDDATRIAGYMLVAFAVAQFFAGPVLGNLSDRFGRRPVLIASMLAFGADYALMAWAPTLAWLFLGRAIAGIAGAVYGPASSVIADVTPPEKRSAAFGYVSAAFGIGFIIGPALGGVIAGLGERAPFIAAAVLALGNAVVMLI
ncbi:tetracycline resistance MFS efflux pump, partial [Sphingomonas sp. HMWF008]